MHVEMMQQQHPSQRHVNHHAHQTVIPKMEFSPTNNNNNHHHHHHRSAEGNDKVGNPIWRSIYINFEIGYLNVLFYTQNGCKPGLQSPIQSFMGPSAAAAAAAAMGQNFVLFPFLDQLHHVSGGFPSPLQSMQPFLQKNNVSSCPAGFLVNIDGFLCYKCC